MKKLLLPILCALMLCGCADTPPEETTASTETTTPAETTAAETTAMEPTTAETTTETTTEAPITTETTYIESLGETKVKLSTMSEEDVKRILIEGGADIPDSYEISYIRYLVRRYEDDPNFVNGVSYSVVAKRLESIQNAVRAYYGMGPFDFEEWYHSFEETTASTEITTPAETTTAEATTMTPTTAETTTETTTEAPIATETTYIESLGETKVKLSTMSEENLRNLLSDAGIEIPEPIKTARLYMLFAMLEEDPEKSSMSYYMIFNTYSVKLRAYAAWDYLPLTEENPALYPKFSEMTDEEIDAFLMKNEIVLPPEIGALDIRAALMSYEKDPLHEIFGEQFPIEEFFDQCRSLMKGYYGIYDPTQDPICMGKPRLSLMSEEECRRILLEGGALILPTHDIQAIRRTVRTCEADPDFIFSFGHYTISELYESIRNAVRAYYGLEPFVYEH